MDIKNLTTLSALRSWAALPRRAATLGYSQSTVSFQIKQLETELDAQLFERVGHTILLTEKGREVLRYAQQVDKLTHELLDNIQQGETLQGRVRMAMADSLCSVFSGEGFRLLRSGIPAVAQAPRSRNRGHAADVNQNEVDLIVTLDSHIYNTEYVIFREEKVGVHFVAGCSSPLAQQADIPLRELVQHPFILTERGMSYRRLMDEKLAGLSLEIQPVLEIGSTDCICALLEQNLGISFLPDYVTEQAVCRRPSGVPADRAIRDRRLEAAASITATNGSPRR